MKLRYAWIIGGVAAGLGTIGGIAIGVNLNESDAGRVMLNLGDLGTWVGAVVTALTALAAIGISIRAQADARKAEESRRRSEEESLQLQQRVWPQLIMFEIVSHGRLPCTIHSVHLVDDENHEKQVDLGFYYGEGKGPVRKRLECRDSLQIPIMTEKGFAREVFKTFDFHLGTRLSLSVRTSLGVHTGSDWILCDEVMDELRHAYQLKRTELPDPPLT